MRRYLESADVTEGKWSFTQFRNDACAWPATSQYLMYGPRAARVCSAAQLVSADFHMDLERPPSFELELELLRTVDCVAMGRMKRLWGGQGMSDNHACLRRNLSGTWNVVEDSVNRRLQVERRLGSHREVSVVRILCSVVGVV